MNNIILKSILCLIIVGPLAAFTHTNATNQPGVDTVLSSNLKGVVVDDNKTPIDFVNVVLLKADSTYLAGTVTDKDGVLCSGALGIVLSS